MVVVRKLAPVLLLLLALVVSGCTSGDDPGADGTGGGEQPPEVQATSTTGGIRGVIVDDRIVPIKGALIQVASTDKNFTTDADGLFAISGLEAGTYVVQASHPLYASAQQVVDVVAGETEPKAVKIQLIRTVFAEPYMQTIQYEGFIVCSANAVFPVVGGILSEECGEGAGVPGVGRVGGQGNNNVQFDFFVDPGAKTLVVEQVWEATSDAGSALYSPISTEWLCDPFCGGNTFAEIEGESPTYAYIGNETLEPLNLTADRVVSIFTWASPSTTPIGATLNQQFTDYVTIFYYVPAPEGWSFVNGDPNPFT